MTRGRGGQQNGGILGLVGGLIGLVALLFVGLMMFFSVADPTIDGMTRFMLWTLIYVVVHGLFAASVVFKLGGIGYKLGERIRAMGHQALWFFRFFASYWAILVVLIGISSFVRPLWWVMLQPVTLIASIFLMPYLINRAANVQTAGDTLRTANATNTAGKAAQTAPVAGLIDTSATERPEPIEAIDTSKTERPRESLADRIYQQPVEPQRINLDPGTLRPDLPNPDWDDKK